MNDGGARIAMDLALLAKMVPICVILLERDIES